jgi:hypothetical protein
MSEPVDSAQIFLWVLLISLFVVIAFLISVLTGCATADPPIGKDGCAVNLKHVCQYVVDYSLEHGTLGEAGGTGEQLERQRLQNVSVRHLEIIVPFRHGSGTLLRCVVDSQTARVTDAGIASGPQFNDADIEHLRHAGLCS